MSIQMIKKVLFLSAGVALILFSCTQPKVEQQSGKNDKPDYNIEGLTIAFYNVENLFDTIDAPDKKDEEWLPDSFKQWNTERYEKKLEDLSKVLSSLREPKLPDIIGLCEVENKDVVEALIASEGLKPGGYKVVHEESPDERGIDVALVYSENFQYLSHQKLTVALPDPEDRTRDILYVEGVSSGDTLHLFVNHWPSRSGGEVASEPNRLAAASALRAKVDELLSVNSKAKVLIMGDFNDFPDNKSVSEVLGAQPTGAQLNNLSYSLFEQGKGTYNYKGNWNMLDQFIVSEGLLNASNGLDAEASSVNIFAPEWVLYKNKEGVFYPSRTYGGPNYYGGFSDHLAIHMQLTYLN